MWFVMFLADNEKYPAMVIGLDFNVGVIQCASLLVI